MSMSRHRRYADARRGRGPPHQNGWARTRGRQGNIAMQGTHGPSGPGVLELTSPIGLAVPV